MKSKNAALCRDAATPDCGDGGEGTLVTLTCLAEVGRRRKLNAGGSAAPRKWAGARREEWKTSALRPRSRR
jgi:hypothetical protein